MTIRGFAEVPGYCLAAVANNQLALVRAAVEKNEVNVDDFFDWQGPGSKTVHRTLSQVAAYHGCVETLQYLLAKGASPNIVSPADGATLLHCACEGASPNCQDVIQLLLDAGADKDATDHLLRKPVDLLLSVVNGSKQNAGHPVCGEHVPRQVANGAGPPGTQRAP
jgi:ankyrin repeat protein